MFSDDTILSNKKKQQQKNNIAQISHHRDEIQRIASAVKSNRNMTEIAELLRLLLRVYNLKKGGDNSRAMTTNM
jgi:hypothetical protein